MFFKTLSVRIELSSKQLLQLKRLKVKISYLLSIHPPVYIIPETTNYNNNNDDNNNNIDVWWLTQLNPHEHESGV